ncbi:MAG: hypothetical protein ABI716_01725 [Candidatus Saccharibacteria bacterium]
METTAQEHLNWATDRALDYFDANDKMSAVTSFLSDVGKHPRTAWIQTHHLTMPMLMSQYDEGRDAFKKFMLGFSV